nr:uncharacterized protein LOC117222647 [Megalopta genalis]
MRDGQRWAKMDEGYFTRELASIRGRTRDKHDQRPNVDLIIAGKTANLKRMFIESVRDPRFQWRSVPRKFSDLRPSVLGPPYQQDLCIKRNHHWKKIDGDDVTATSPTTSTEIRPRYQSPSRRNCSRQSASSFPKGKTCLWRCFSSLCQRVYSLLQLYTAILDTVHHP